LADKLEADWVNLARPGCSNYWMLEKLQDLQPYIQMSNYKKIYLVITLTEDLREAEYTRRIQVLPAYQKFWEESTSIQDFLQSVENYLFDNLQRYFDSVKVEPYVGRAFTDSWQTRTWSLDKTWCDVIQDKFNFNNYQKPVPFIAQMSINPLTQKFIEKNPERKIEFLDIMERVATRWNFLGASEYNLKGSTCHPNPAGHQLWADYLFAKLNK
jgi:lysophospholipase L1-like esterase